VIVGTGFLVLIRLLGLRLRLLVDSSVFIGTYYLFSIFFGFWAGIAAGAIALAIRALPYLISLNFTTFLSIESFSLLFGLFLKWDLVLVLLAGMAVYDVVAVFYTKHMKFLWFGGWLDEKVEKPYWRDTLAFFFPEKARGSKGLVSVIGAGDFALPAMFVVSVAQAGGFLPATICAVFCSAGFLLLERGAGESKRTGVTGIPGIPTIALGAVLGIISCRALGLLP